eukprot:GHVO01010228.1.p2 GENE.GHVO01010228.1~~GHVO01010228.1.p2  ORF type:complete len:155 (+),score=32.63 GHVO01010228.1:236-700(+)
MAKLQARGRAIGSGMGILNSAAKASIAARRLENVKKGDDAQAEEQKKWEDALPLILETMLRFCLVDIEETTRSASKKVLKDMKVPMETRKKRAHALIELGRILKQASQEAKKTRTASGAGFDARRHMEEAYIKAVQKMDEDAHQTKSVDNRYDV